MNVSEKNLPAKERIIIAVAELMQKDSISKITVANVLEQADISRSTFYRYYTDVYHVYETAVADFIEKCSKLFSDVFLTKKLPIEKIKSSLNEGNFFPGAFSFTETDITIFRYFQENEPLLFFERLNEAVIHEPNEEQNFALYFLLNALITAYTLDYFKGNSFNADYISITSDIIERKNLFNLK